MSKRGRSENIRMNLPGGSSTDRGDRSGPQAPIFSSYRFDKFETLTRQKQVTQKPDQKNRFPGGDRDSHHETPIGSIMYYLAPPDGEIVERNPSVVGSIAGLDVGSDGIESMEKRIRIAGICDKDVSMDSIQNNQWSLDGVKADKIDIQMSGTTDKVINNGIYTFFPGDKVVARLPDLPNDKIPSDLSVRDGKGVNGGYGDNYTTGFIPLRVEPLRVALKRQYERYTFDTKIKFAKNLENSTTIESLQNEIVKIPSPIVYDVCMMAYRTFFDASEKKPFLDELQNTIYLEQKIRSEIHYSGDLGHLIIGTVVTGPSDETNGTGPKTRLHILLEKNLG